MKKFVFILSFFICSNLVWGQEKSIVDSVFTLQAAEITAESSKVNLLNIDIPLRFLPMTVTTLSSDVLQRKNILNLEDAVRFLPGVTVTDQYGAFQRYSIRGVSDAVVAIDGVRDERTLMTNVPFGDLSAVESIEVIKGPASILSGHSVMGGVINIVRKKAQANFTANANIGYGSWKAKQATLGFGGKLMGPVNYRANVHYSTSEGYRKVGADRFSGLFSLSSAIGREGLLTATADFSDDKYRTEIGSAPIMPGQIFTANDNKEFANMGDRNPMANYKTVYNDIANNNMNRKTWNVDVQYTQKLTDWMSLRNSTAIGKGDLNYSAVEGMNYRTSTNAIYDWYYTNNKGVKTYIELDSLKSGTPLCFNPKNTNFTNSLELTGKFDLGLFSNKYNLGWTTSYFDYTQYNGYNMKDKDATGNPRTPDVWGPGIGQMVSLDNPNLVRNWWNSKVSAATIRRQITNGIYLIDVIDINEQWKAMLGGRMDFYSYKSATANIFDGKQKYDRDNRSDWKKVSTTAFTYRAGAVYLPIPSVSIYASASSFFRPNNTIFNNMVVYLDKNGNRFNPNENGGEVFKPEKGHQAEIGVRYTLNHLLEVNASTFYINKYNVVKKVGTLDEMEENQVVTKNIMAQVGRADSKGFDFELILRPYSTLQITSGLGWSDYRLREISKSETLGDSEAKKNLRATGAPRTTFYTYADYTIPKGVLKDLSFHLSGTFTDKVYKNITDNTYFPSRYIVDAGCYYTIKKHINLAVIVNNLFDKQYYTKNTVMAKPTNVMATISYTFK